MRMIGLLGGMSWESSIAYERIMNEEVRRRLGGMHAADLLVRSYDFAEIERLQAAGDWEGAGARLAADARCLEAAGAEAILLCTNTMHRVAPAIEAALTVPFLHLADTTAAAVTRAGVTSVGLLGTKFTMEASFYRDRLARRGLDVRIPSPDARDHIHGIIYDELVRGRVEPRSRALLVDVASTLIANGARGIISGCTELELLLQPSDLSVPLFPTARLHALAAVDFALRA
ncbi:MAG: aspartate/glutamate racemase family protein [Myxococcota bacterium]